MRFVWLSLLLVARQLRAQNSFPFCEELCSVGDEDCCSSSFIPDDANGAIFHEEEFTCEGLIVRWEFKVIIPGTFYACVWKPDLMDGTFILQSLNEIVVTATTDQTYDVPLEKQIHVKPGHVIGTLHKQGSLGVLHWNPTGPLYTKVGRFRYKSDNSEDLQCSDQVAMGDTTTGQAALKAVVEGPSPDLQLVPTSVPALGRAEMFINGQWGSICDLWYEVGGWPSTFCKSLGFPMAKDVRYVVNLTSSDVTVPAASATMPIHLMSPNLCKPSLGLTMPNCPVHDNGTCDHDLDVYVECQRKVRCLDKTVTVVNDTCVITTCTPQFWLKGCWGYICDTRGDSFHVNNDESWTAAFCQELGLGEALALSPQPASFNATYPNLLVDPVCEVFNPTNIEECPPCLTDVECDPDTGVFRLECQACDTP